MFDSWDDHWDVVVRRLVLSQYKKKHDNSTSVKIVTSLVPAIPSLTPLGSCSKFEIGSPILPPFTISIRPLDPGAMAPWRKFANPNHWWCLIVSDRENCRLVPPRPGAMGWVNQPMAPWRHEDPSSWTVFTEAASRVHTGYVRYRCCTARSVDSLLQKDPRMSQEWLMGLQESLIIRG